MQELKAFAKVRLDSGESTTVTLELGARSFAYWDVADTDWPLLAGRRANPGQHIHDGPLHRQRAGWYLDGGTYELHVGRSSADIAHRVAVEVAGGPEPLDPASPLD